MSSPVIPGISILPLGFVNAYLLDTSDGPILVDAGFPGSAPKFPPGASATSW